MTTTYIVSPADENSSFVIPAKLVPGLNREPVSSSIDQRLDPGSGSGMTERKIITVKNKPPPLSLRYGVSQTARAMMLPRWVGMLPIRLPGKQGWISNSILKWDRKVKGNLCVP